MSSAMHDLAIDDALVYDGTGAPPRRASVAIAKGRVVDVRAQPFGRDGAREHLDGRGRWLVPGFVDCHTHYDGEVEAAPGLLESLRHGVTTCVLGSCSLGMVHSEPLDLADMFTRVEAVPRAAVLPLLEARKRWRTAAEYRTHLDGLALGPNLAAFLGHSDVRAHVMGLGRSVTRGERPSRDELARMTALVEDALDAGYLGLSVSGNRWDKLDGERWRSKPVPSSYARWSELSRLARVLRRRGRVLQAVPDLSGKLNVFLFLGASVGWLRPALKASLLSMADVRSNRLIHRAIGLLSRLVNTIGRGDFRWQALPARFEMYVDGLDAPVFEEFRAGSAALHLVDMAERRALLRDPGYRAWFRRQWESWLLPRVFHRDLGLSEIVASPDPSLVGRSFADVARDRGLRPVDAFLDLCAEHGDALRWHTVIANDRPRELRRILAHPDVMIGFSDAGAHLRNMAFYNFGLRMLKLARDAEREGVPYMPIERAVHRVTGELADWLGIDAGRIAVGRRADLALVDPERLDERLDAFETASVPELGGIERMVNRHDDVVEAAVVGGRVAVRRGVPVPSLGREGMGRFLGAGESVESRPVSSPASLCASGE